ncbi:Zn-ribbon domain-containing OB-fold protein [Amycolatopsis pithecellobii]|uniref:Zn-ribbon domain-containing OB-fold protein n=1 Tax=Amycolatopsis pithecellobii TaxID=664692 RepID=UPI001409B4ED|nr:OB-fold domain-containing protein [Amycolatopsis pithecellobii]
MLIFDEQMARPRVDDPDTLPFWEGCREHRLVVQQCARCGEYRFAPVPLCHCCQSWETTWVESAGRGRVYTWTVTPRAIQAGTASAVPYNTTVIELDDCGGALITSNVLDIDNDQLRPGLPVEVVWDDVSDDVTVPRFRPVSYSDREKANDEH